jgi:hypothetical protein
MNNLSRRSILAGATAIPAAVAVPALMPAIAVDDPIFAAIDQHRRAETAYCAAWDDCEVGDGTLTSEIRDLEERAGEIGDDAFGKLIELAAMTPTTVAGCAALLRHVEWHLTKYDHVPVFEDFREDLEEHGKTLLGRIATALEKTI